MFSAPRLLLRRCISTGQAGGVIKKPIINRGNDDYKHIMLIIPIAAFGLGTWQVYRWQWKLSLIKKMEEKTTAEPIDLPMDLSKIDELEYRRVRVKGKFDHTHEMFLAPRSLVIKDRDNAGGGLISAGNRASIGVWVIAPFELSDRKERILVNRGWVARDATDPRKRLEGQVEGEIELVGVVRKTEKRPPFGQKNDESKNEWQHRDLNAMALKLDTLPVFIDADSSSTVPGGPIGGQTRVSLRNEHLSYILTWYGLSGFTTYMWYLKFYKRFPLLI